MLRDHFRPPLSDRFGWESFHAGWAHNLAAALNAVLPDGWRATSRARFGLEVDVGAYDERPSVLPEDAPAWVPGGDAAWAPAAPLVTLDFPPMTDSVEVLVTNFERSPSLVGAVEFVSPRNKDRPEARDAFAAKCEATLREGAGLVVVDVVTTRRTSLHRTLLARLGGELNGAAGGAGPAACPALYAAAYRPHGGADEPRLDVWEECLTVGGDIPAVPLFLRVGPRVRLDLAGTYEETRRDLKIP